MSYRPRDIKIVLPVDWNEVASISAVSVAEAEFTHKISSIASHSNLEIIRAEFNSPIDLLAYYTKNEREISNLPQREHWWMTDSAKATEIRKEIQKELEKIELTCPRYLLNILEDGKNVLFFFARRYEDLKRVLIQNLDEEKHRRSRIDSMESRFHKECTDLMKSHGDLQYKAIYLIEIIKNRSLQFKERWSNPSSFQLEYLNSLEEIFQALEAVLDNIDTVPSNLSQSMDSFVDSSEYMCVYFGLRHVHRDIRFYEKTHKFQASLQKLKNNLPTLNWRTTDQDAEIFLKGTKRYISESEQMCVLIGNYGNTIFTTLEGILKKLNLAEDENSRIDHIMPLYEKDERAYEEAFIVNMSNASILDESRIIIEKCFQSYSFLQKTPEALEKTFERRQRKLDEKDEGYS